MRNRKSIRLKDFDYSQNGTYYITICTKNRENLFGDIINDKMIFNKYGKIAENVWLEIPVHFPYVVLDEYIIMPNHIHGILIVDVGNRQMSVRNRHACSLHQPQYKTIPVIIGSFKSAASKLIHNEGFHDFKWQRSYYDHVIRD